MNDYIEYDNELLAQLFQESNILKCKTNRAKRDRWVKLAEKYCREKNIDLIDHTKLQRKWGRLVKAAQKKKSKAKKDARATGGGAPSSVRLDQENELVLWAAEANADMTSNFDCGPNDIGGEDPLGAMYI